MRKRWIALTSLFALAAVFSLATASVSLAENTESTQGWQVRAIPTPIPSATPSFISASSGYLAWTGAEGGGVSDLYVFTLVSGANTRVPGCLPGNYYNPSADGPWVVYQGARLGAYDDIYLYEVNSGLVRQITQNSDPGDAHDWNPRIDQRRIVWERQVKDRAARPGIYLYDIDTGTASLLLEGDQYHDPDIWEDYVVCTKSTATGGSEIILYNLATQETRSIADSTRSNEDPRIDSGIVVWSSGDVWSHSAPEVWFTYQIQMYNINSGTLVSLTGDVRGNTKPSVKSELVAWRTKEPVAVMVYDAATRTYTELSAQADTVNSLEVDNNGVAWCGNRGLYYAVPASEATRFLDVPSNHLYATAIESIAEREIIQGYSNGYFGPNDHATRQQFTKMILLTLAVYDPGRYTPTLSDSYEFSDSQSIERKSGELYPYHYIAKAALTGLVKGYPDGTFRPTLEISRQQVITMIVRASSRFLTPPPSNWPGVLSYANPEHGQRIRLAEYNGLLSGIVGPTGTLAGWDTTDKATRGEVAQMLYNLLGKMELAWQNGPGPVAP